MKPFLPSDPGSSRFKISSPWLAVLVVWATTSMALADNTADAARAWAASLSAETAGDYQTAIARMNDFSNVFPDPYLVAVRTGWLCYMQRDYARAADHYLEATKVMPTAITPYLGLIYTYQAANLPEKTKEACKAVLLKDPLNTSALKMLAAISYDQADFVAAARYYRILVEAHPEDPAYLSGAGWSYLKLEKNQQAAVCFQRLLILSPGYDYAEQGYKEATGNNSTN